MLGSKRVFVLRQGFYVAQVGLKLWTSGISVFTSPVLGYRLIQPHLAYGVLGSQSTTSYRLQALTMSLASQKCVCVYACVVCTCVCNWAAILAPKDRAREGREIDWYLYTFLNMCGDQRSTCRFHLLSCFLTETESNWTQNSSLAPLVHRNSVSTSQALGLQTGCYIYLGFIWMLGIWTPGPHSWGANILSTDHHRVPQRHLQSSCSIFSSVYSQRKGKGPGVSLQDDHTVNPNIAIYWKNLFLVVVWLSRSTHV